MLSTSVTNSANQVGEMQQLESGGSGNALEDTFLLLTSKHWHRISAHMGGILQRDFESQNGMFVFSFVETIFVLFFQVNVTTLLASIALFAHDGRYLR